MITNELKDYFDGFTKEAELFFVSKFKTGNALEKEYSNCIDIIFNITKTVDPGRGIIAVNPKYGQGKSFFFEVINHWYRRTHGNNLFKMTSAKELVKIYTSTEKNVDPIIRLDEFISARMLFIDDIGDEGKDKMFHNYSNKLNVIRYVLLKRYEFWVEKGWRTYGTTNLTLEDIAVEYDGRVSDRLSQMCYIREFKFLGKGSFRQMEDTRKLTQLEIKENWKKFKVKTVAEKIDLEKYFNELVAESDQYFEGKDISFWTFVKTYLIDKGFLIPADFEKITEDDLINARTIVRYDVRENKKTQYRHAPADLRQIKVEEAVNAIRKKDILNVAQNKVAREKFMELRNNKHQF